jgi:hypothetical protein
MESTKTVVEGAKARPLITYSGSNHASDMFSLDFG